jgi:hypothetical protein
MTSSLRKGYLAIEQGRLRKAKDLRIIISWDDVRQTTKHAPILLKRAQKRNAWGTNCSLTELLLFAKMKAWGT